MNGLMQPHTRLVQQCVWAGSETPLGSSPGDLKGLSVKRNKGSRRDVWGNPDSFLLCIVQGKRCFLPPQNPIGII